MHTCEPGLVHVLSRAAVHAHVGALLGSCFAKSTHTCVNTSVLLLCLEKASGGNISRLKTALQTTCTPGSPPKFELVYLVYP